MPSKVDQELFHSMSVAYVNGNDDFISIEGFDDPDDLVIFLEDHQSDPVKPLVMSGKPNALTLTIESKKVITTINKKKP
jgi:hypothetical protein